MLCTPPSLGLIVSVEKGKGKQKGHGGGGREHEGSTERAVQARSRWEPENGSICIGLSYAHLLGDSTRHRSNVQ